MTARGTRCYDAARRRLAAREVLVRMSIRLAGPVLIPIACAVATILSSAPAAAAGAEPEAVAAEFASRLSAALSEGPLAQDALWAPGLRDSTQRLLEARDEAGEP